MAGYIGPIPVPQATQSRETFTATASQTSFGTAGYQVGYLDVFMNGVKLAPADFTATNGSDVVLASGAAVNDIIEVVSYSAFEVLNQNFTGTTVVDNLTVGGNLTVDGTTTTINSTTLNVDDINITVASGAADSAAANGAGLTVDGAGATFNYSHSGTKWTMNKPLDVGGNLDVTGTLSSDGLTVDGTVGIGGRITADAGIDIDNIIIDGSTITSNTHLNLDIVGDLRIDVDGAEVKLADGGTEFGILYKTGDNFAIFSSVSDGNLLLQGNDGGSTITALTLDMSDAGSATFNHDVFLPSAGNLYFTSGGFNPRISNSNSDTALSFFTNNVERFQIATGGDVQVLTGNLHIGTDSAGSYPKTGHSIRGGDSAIFSRTGTTGETMQVRRQNSTGEYVRFYSGASTIDGGIKVDGGSMVIGGGDVGIGYYQGANALVPYDYNNNSVRDAAIDLGYPSTFRWKDLYLSGGVDFGGAVNSGGVVSSSNKLDDYEEGTWTPSVKGANGNGGTTTYGNTPIGLYTKIGNLVTVTCVIYNTAHTGSGAAHVFGLPFACSSSGEAVGTYQVNTHSTAYASGITQVAAIIQGSNSHIHFRGYHTGTSTGPYYVPMQNFTYLRATITYPTTA